MVYASGRLRYLGRTLAATCGRGGVRDDKREGDGATPRGILRIAALMYRPDRIAPPALGRFQSTLEICGVMIRPTHRIISFAARRCRPVTNRCVGQIRNMTLC